MSDYLILLLEQVTFFSSVTALILIAVKLIFRCRIPPRIGMALWIILLARLICPVFPESRFSVYNLIPAGKEILYAVQNGGEESGQPETEQPLASNPYVLTDAEDAAAGTAAVKQTDRNTPDYTIGGYLTDGEEGGSERINRLVLTAYLCGVCVFLTASLVLYTAARRRALRGTIAADDERLLALYRETAEDMGLNVKRLPQLRFGSVTMLAGVLKPCLVCREEDFSEENRIGVPGRAYDRTAENAARMVLAHELTHYRFGDNPLLVFSTFVNCLFWFNPLIWVVRHMLREDVEVLCDARTLEYCGIPGTEYALMLCRESAFDALSEGGFAVGAAGCRMSRSGRHLKNRLKTISHRSRRRFLPRAVSWMLCAGIIAVCLTNPVLSRSGEYGTYVDHYAKLTGADRNALMRKETATVSEYLGEVSQLLRRAADVRVSTSLEQLKRALDECAERAAGDGDLRWLNSEIGQYKADEVLTNRSMAAVNAAVMTVLGVGYGGDGSASVLGPEISAERMDKVLALLSDQEAETLLLAYNRGVRGARVSFEAFYTDEMMELILSRIRSDWDREKFSGFYQKIELTPESRAVFSEELSTAVSESWKAESVYMRDPGMTKVEEAELSRIIGAAMAGEREDVYYLKRTEDGVSRETTARLLEQGGYTAYDRLTDTAWIGDFPGIEQSGDAGDGIVSDRLTGAVPAVRNGLRAEGIALETIGFSRSGEVYRLMDRSYRLGLAEASEDGILDPAKKLSAGEGIAMAYRFVTALTASEG